MDKVKKRCTWAGSNPLMIKYHDEEWGVPVHSDKKLFEFINLEGAQAGLSWEMILNKRENYRKTFDNFNVKKISEYTEKDIVRLLNNPGIIRNRLKVKSTVNNAQKFLEIKREFGTFSKYIWQFTNGKTIVNKWKREQDLPASTSLSDKLSKDLLKRGFKFVGSTIMYAHMQATGMVNDHMINCFRYKEVNKLNS